MEGSDIIHDDERDALNDETFGGDVEEIPWDWEDSTLSFFDTTRENLQHNEHHGLKSEKRRMEKQDDTDDDDYDIDNIKMEESIARLVLDDENEAEAKSKRLATSHAYFMPPQVVNKNLNWLMEKDLPEEGWFFGSSVWSMHPTIPAAPIQNPCAPAAEGAFDSPERIPLIAHTKTNVTEPAVSIGGPPTLGPVNGNPVVRTLEEIEREQFLESARDKSSADKFKSADQGVIGSAKVITITELEMNDIENNPPCRGSIQGTWGGGGQSITRFPPGNRPLGSDIFLGPNLPIPPLQLFHLPTSRQSPHAYAPIRHIRPPIPPPLIYPPLLPPPNVMMHNMNLMNMNARSGFYWNEPRCIMENRYRPDYGGGVHTPIGRPRHALEVGPCGYGDPYAGLMTQSEKQRLRNIQMIQLQNDYPFRKDYYNQMLQFKTTTNVAHLRRLFPFEEPSGNKKGKEYTPATFEHALGKLQAVSALAPRKVIDTSGVRVNVSSKRREYSLRSQLLCEIERLYEIYLDAREVAFRVVARTGLVSEREKVTEKLVHVLEQNGSRIMQWMKIRKGRGLILDIIAYLFAADQEEAASSLLAEIVKNAPVQMLYALNEENEDVILYKKIDRMIFNAKVEHVDQLLQAFHEDLWKSRFGRTVFYKTLERAAVLGIHFSSVNKTARESGTYVCRHSWKRDAAPEERGADYDTSASLEGFQKIPSLVDTFVQGSDDEQVLCGGGNVSVNGLVELMEKTQVLENVCIACRTHFLNDMANDREGEEKARNIMDKLTKMWSTNMSLGTWGSTRA